MAVQPISQDGNSSVKKPIVIEKPIPGSNIKVIFYVQKNESNRPVIHTTITAEKNNDAQHVPNVSLESFPDGITNPNFKKAVLLLRERAIDYIRNKIVFLPENPTALFKNWASEKSKFFDKTLIGSVKIIEKDSFSKELVDAYLCLGNAYYNSSNYRYALLCFHKLYVIAEHIHFREGLGLAHNGLGSIYSKLGEIGRAIAHHQEDLKISEEVPKKKHEIQLRAYSNLGNIYENRGNYQEAESCHQKFLRIACCLRPPDPTEVADALVNLGRVFEAKGDYKKAKHYYQKSIEKSPNIAASSALALLDRNFGRYKEAIEAFKKLLGQTDNPSEKSFLYSNLASVYEDLGQFDRALEYHHKDLETAKQIEDAESEARAYHNIGKTLIAKEEEEKGIDYCLENALPLAVKIGDRQLQAMIFGALGTVLSRFEKYEQALEFHKTHLEIATEIEDLEGQGTAYNGLGNVYLFKDQYELAIESYQKALEAARLNGTKDSAADVLYNLGRAFELKGENVAAIGYFQDSIHIYLELQRENCQDNLQWQISLFESQYRAFRCLERALQAAGKSDEALLAADSSRAKSLVHFLNRKLQLSTPDSLSSSKIRDLARKLQTVFVIYSCDPFDENKAWCRVIPSEGDIHYYPINLVQTSREIPTFENGRASVRGESKRDTELKGKKIQEAIKKWVADTELGIERGNPEVDNTKQQQNNTEIFKRWYTDFIAPIESYLPGQGQRVTIIPDAFLHDLPFALFQDSQGKYLFEKYALITAPSIETLFRLEELNQKHESQRAFENIGVITNGDANTDYSLPPLLEVKSEGNTVASFFPKSPPPVHDANVEELKTAVIKSGCIHLACHGLADVRENKHSVFAGALVMKDRLLYAEDIANLPLNAGLAVLGACHSGQGKLHREGTIGLPFAFLAAGVSSVIATRWKIFDKVTSLIVSEFYKHYLGKSEEAQHTLKAGKLFGPAEALREAMLFAKKRFPQYPQAWGAFFFVGLSHQFRPLETSSPSIIPTILDTKPFTWIDLTTGNQFQFFMKNGVVNARFVPKSNPGETPQTVPEFQESEIQVQMVTLTQIQQGMQQNKLPMNDLIPSVKEEVLASLNRRKVKIIGKEIMILALN